MSIFDDGISADAFSDEALGFVPAETEIQAEPTPQQTDSNSAEIPQEKAAPEAPADGIAVDAKEVLEAEDKPDTEAKVEENVEINERLRVAEKRAKDNQAAFTRKNQELLILQAQYAAMQQEIEALKNAAASASPENREEAVKNFVADPMDYIKKTAAPLVEQRVRETLKPLQEAIERENASRVFSDGMGRVLKDYPNLKGDRESQKHLVEEAVNISREFGDEKLWAKSPEIMSLAAQRLYGASKIINQNAIAEAEARGREAALAEFSAKESAKAGKTAIANNNANANEVMSEDDRIRAEIANALPGGFW